MFSATIIAAAPFDDIDKLSWINFACSHAQISKRLQRSYLFLLREEVLLLTKCFGLIEVIFAIGQPVAHERTFNCCSVRTNEGAVGLVTALSRDFYWRDCQWRERERERIKQCFNIYILRCWTQISFVLALLNDILLLLNQEKFQLKRLLNSVQQA